MSGWLAELAGAVSAGGVGLVVGATVLAGFLRGFVGFGSAMVTVPVFSLVFGPLVALPIANLTALPAVVQILPAALREADRGFVLPLSLAIFAAAPFGTWALVVLDPALTKIAIAAIVLAMVWVLGRGWRLARRPGPALLIGAGGCAGLIQGLAGVGGPPAVAVALAGPGDVRRRRANVIAVVTALTLCSVPPLWYHGLFTGKVIVASLLLIPIYVASTWLGTRVFDGRGQRHYRRAALAVLALVGGASLIVAVRDYLTA